MKLAIIGNGFDLHHGLKTSFNSFREYLIDSGEKNDLVSKIDLLINKQKKILKYDSVDLAWNNIEVILNSEFESLPKNEENIEKFEEIVEEFVEEFYKYLTIEESKTSIVINSNIKKMIEDTDVFLVFNYTKTYLAYIKKDDIDVFHIHGSLNNDNLPLIGYQKPNITIYDSTDYYVRYNYNIIQKSAMAYKQNMRELEKEISDFINKYKAKISDVIVIGYSFGNSDSHIYKIINNILIEQIHSRNINYIDAEKISKINFYMFSYNENETKELISKITNEFKRKHNRNMTVRTFGNGIRKTEVELVEFHLVEY